MKLLCFFAAAWLCASGMCLHAENAALPLKLVHSGETISSRSDYFTVKEGLAGKKFLIAGCSFLLKSNPGGFHFNPGIRFFNRSGKIIQEVKFSELLPRLDKPEIVEAEEYLPIPAAAEKAAILVQFYGNPGEIEVLRSDFTLSDTKEHHPPVVYKKFKEPFVLDDRQLDEMLAKMTPVQAEIRRCGQYNGMFFNGREIVPAIYYTSYYKDRDNSNFSMIPTFCSLERNAGGMGISSRAAGDTPQSTFVRPLRARHELPRIHPRLWRM